MVKMENLKYCLTELVVFREGKKLHISLSTTFPKLGHDLFHSGINMARYNKTYFGQGTLGTFISFQEPTALTALFS